MNDRYTKIVLTIIAAALFSISLRMWIEPRMPTIGELRASDDKAAVIGRVPLIRIQSGNIDAEVSGSIDATVSQ